MRSQDNWPEAIAHKIFRAGDTPTPFTADEIRTGCPEGRTTVTRIEEAGEPVRFREARFTACDSDGAMWQYRIISDAGEAMEDWQGGRSLWTEYQSHASMPREETTITEEPITIACGAFDCYRYVRRSTKEDGIETVRSFWFAKEFPGAPAKVEVRENGIVSYITEWISDTEVARRRGG